MRYAAHAWLGRTGSSGTAEGSSRARSRVSETSGKTITDRRPAAAATAPGGASPAASCAPSGSRRGSPRRAHFAALWGSAIVTLARFDAAPPVTQWGAEEVAIDLFHHAVYITAAAVAYELL